MNLTDAWQPERVRSDIGLPCLQHLCKGIVHRMMGVLERYLDWRWVYSHLVSGVEWGV